MKVSADSMPGYAWGDGCHAWPLWADAELSVKEERMPAGTAEQRHYHRRARQFFYVLAGRAVMELGGIRHALDAGEGLAVPAGQPHRISNEGPSLLRFLVLSQPNADGDRVTEPGTGDKHMDTDPTANNKGRN